MVFEIIAPIFILIGLGFIATKVEIMPKESMVGMSRFILYFALPCLVFKNLVSVDLDDIFNFTYILAYAGGGIIAMIVGVGVSHYFYKDTWSTAGVKGMGCGISNTPFLGYPIVLSVVEQSAALAFTLTIVIENIILLPIALIFIESFRGSKSGTSAWRGVIKRTAIHPILIGVYFGLACLTFNIEVPNVIMKSIEILGSGASPVGLTIIGTALAGITRKALWEHLQSVPLIATAKLLIHPAVVLLLLLVLPPMSQDMTTAVIIFASLPMISIYPVLGFAYNQHEFCAASLLVTTLISFFSLSLLLFVLI